MLIFAKIWLFLWSRGGFSVLWRKGVSIIFHSQNTGVLCHSMYCWHDKLSYDATLVTIGWVCFFDVLELRGHISQGRGLWPHPRPSFHLFQWQFTHIYHLHWLLHWFSKMPYLVFSSPKTCLVLQANVWSVWTRVRVSLGWEVICWLLVLSDQKRCPLKALNELTPKIVTVFWLATPITRYDVIPVNLEGHQMTMWVIFLKSLGSQHSSHIVSLHLC